MKKLYILAALLMATTSAQAGGITFQINGERVRVEAPRNCTAISCFKITSPGYTGTLGNIDLKGMGSKRKVDDDVVATAPAAPAHSGPVHRAAAPAPAATAWRLPPLKPPLRREPKLRRPPRFRRLRRAPAPAPHRRRWPQPPRPTRTRRLASGRRKRTRATFASRNAAPIYAAIPSTPAKGF